MDYPTNFVEAICFPVGAFVIEYWHHLLHPSVGAGICLGIVVKVALRRAREEEQASQ